MRRYVIGDVHGCDKALRSLRAALQFRSDDEVIFVGDYVDRGPNSRNVIEQLIDLGQRCRVVALRGNHEVMLQAVAIHGKDESIWMRSGGKATVVSYGGSITKIPSSHLDFFQRLQRCHETDGEIFVHAMYDPQQSVSQQSDELTYWAHLPNPLPYPHASGKRVFVGHTPQPRGEILWRSHLVGLDTYCFGGGYLSAVDLETGAVTQADRHGHIRRVPIQRALHALACCGRWLRKR